MSGEIVERLERATGPDRALDLAICQALNPIAVVMRQRDDDTGADPYTHWRYTDLVGDAMDLAIAKLDNGSVDIEVAYRSVGGLPCGRAEICGSAVYGQAFGPTPAIALLIALFRALESSNAK